MFGIFGRLLWESLNGMLTLSDIKGTTSNFWFFCVSVKWRDKDSHNKLPKMPNILHVVRSLYLFIWHIYTFFKKRKCTYFLQSCRCNLLNEEIKASNYVQNVRNFQQFVVGVFKWDFQKKSKCTYFSQSCRCNLLSLRL